MRKKALIVLADGFEEIEAITPIDILRRAGIDVTVAGLKAIDVKGSRLIQVKADRKLEEVSNDEYDVYIFPGGSLGAKNLASSKLVKSIIEKANKDGKIIAAICASPALLLAPAGILSGKSATCYPGMETEFDRSINFKDEDVVFDGNIITSKGPATAFAFSFTIVEKLLDKAAAERIEKAVLF